MTATETTESRLGRLEANVENVKGAILRVETMLKDLGEKIGRRIDAIESCVEEHQRTFALCSQRQKECMKKQEVGGNFWKDRAGKIIDWGLPVIVIFLLFLWKIHTP